MRFPPMFRSLAVLVVLTGLATGCVRRIPDADPAEIPTLRQQLAASPGDLEVRTRLGIALYRAGSHDEAHLMLDSPLVRLGALVIPANSGAVPSVV